MPGTLHTSLGVVVAAFSHIKVYTFPTHGIALRGDDAPNGMRIAIVDVDGVEIMIPKEFHYEVNIHQDVAQFGDLIPRGSMPVNPRTHIDLGWTVYGPSAGDTVQTEHVDEEPTP